MALTLPGFSLLVNPNCEMRASRLLNGFHTLRIHDRGARVRVPAHPLTFGHMEGTVQAEPKALKAPASEVVEDRLPRRKVGGQIAPRAAGAQDVENGVKDPYSAAGAERFSDLWQDAQNWNGATIVSPRSCDLP